MRIAAVVLAAGRSERMGRPKPLLPCRGDTFLGTVLATLNVAGVNPVRVVLGHGARDIQEAIRLPREIVVVNPSPDDGMLSSVRCGLSALPEGHDGFLLWPVDHPLVAVGTVLRLIQTFGEEKKGIVLPCWEGRRGHPSLFATRLTRFLLAAPDSVGARAVLRSHPEEILEVPVADPGVVTDIDTPEAYARACGIPP